MVAWLAASAATPASDRNAEYAACLRQVEQDPASAFATANSWAERGGGHPARHCGALALLKLKDYERAATSLEQLAADMTRGDGDLAAEALAQAGQAWL